MLPTLMTFAKATHSYGWAILLLTMAVRLIVWPLVSSSTKAMRKNSQLQPKLKQLQDRYKDNPELLQRKMMEFYKKNKMNPLGGCLPTLVQLPILFALFGTFTGPPFQDKAIPVKVNLVAASSEGKVTTNIAPSSSGNSPYLAPGGQMSKLVVKPGDETAVFGKDANGKETGEAKEIDYQTFAVDGTLPPDFKPKWRIGHDVNGAVIVAESGQATFPKEGQVKVACLLPDNQRIVVPVTVVARTAEDEEPPIISFFAPKSPFKGAKEEHSKETVSATIGGKQVNIAVSPGACSVLTGKSFQFTLQALDGSPLPMDYKYKWHIVDDSNAATIDDNGHAVFRCPGEVTIEAVVPAIAKNDSFYFISSIGKVSKGMELFEPANWDVLFMIIAFTATMVASQKLMMQPNPAGMTEDQIAIQKQTQQTMPIAITAMFFFIPLPAGVYLYMVLSNVMQSLQTWLIMKNPAPTLEDVHDEAPGDSSDAKIKTDSKSKNSIAVVATPVEDDESDLQPAGETGENAVKLTGGKKKSKKKR